MKHVHVRQYAMKPRDRREGSILYFPVPVVVRCYQDQVLFLQKFRNRSLIGHRPVAGQPFILRILIVPFIGSVFTPQIKNRLVAAFHNPESHAGRGIDPDNGSQSLSDKPALDSLNPSNSVTVDLCLVQHKGKQIQRLLFSFCLRRQWQSLGSDEFGLSSR